MSFINTTITNNNNDNGDDDDKILREECLGEDLHKINITLTNTTTTTTDNNADDDYNANDDEIGVRNLLPLDFLEGSSSYAL